MQHGFDAVLVFAAQPPPEPGELGLLGRLGGPAEHALPVVAHQRLREFVAVGGHPRPLDQVGDGLAEKDPGLRQGCDTGPRLGQKLRGPIGAIGRAHLLEVVGDVEPLVAREGVAQRVERGVATGAGRRLHALVVVVGGLAGHGGEALEQGQIEAEVGAVRLRRRGAGHGREHGEGHQEPPVREHAGAVVAIDELRDVFAAREHIIEDVAVEGGVGGRETGRAGNEVGADQQVARVVIVDLAVDVEGEVVVVVGERNGPRALAALDALVRPDLAVGEAPQRAVLAAPRLALEAAIERGVQLGLRVGGARERFVLVEGGRAAAEVEVDLAERVAQIVPAGPKALDFEGRVAVRRGAAGRVAGARAGFDFGEVGDAVAVGVERLDGRERFGQPRGEDVVGQRTRRPGGERGRQGDPVVVARGRVEVALRAAHRPPGAGRGRRVARTELSRRRGPGQRLGREAQR